MPGGEIAASISIILVLGDWIEFTEEFAFLG
jgi:hypothetical protein